MYTWLLRSSLKSCGIGVRLYFPVRFGKPESISLGAGCLVYPRAWINVVTAWKGATYDGEIRIGDRVGIGYDVQISAARSIVIEDDVAIARGVVIVDHLHDYRYLDVPIFEAPLSAPGPVRIGKGSFLGAHCMICPGVQIGEHSLVSANSVVVNDVPAFSMAVGNPARIVRFRSPLTNAPMTQELAESNHA
jgi:acetyltransferase-like isoleucine patch superfamily enzyme